VHCKGAVRVTGFGRLYKGVEQDWTLRHFKNFEDAVKETSITRHLPEIATALGVREILAPTPEFGSAIVSSNALGVRIPLGGSGGIVLRRGAMGDLMELKPGETFGISTGGCAVIWAYYKSHYARLVVGHVGRKNLEHVVDKVWEHLRVPQFAASEVVAGVAFPISPVNFEHRFDDPTYGELNRTFCERLVTHWGTQAVLGWDDPAKRELGRIDIGWVVRQQFRKHGVPSQHMHGTPGYDLLSDIDNLPLWHTTRGALGKELRNLVLVTHLSRHP
jgi:hypothetical protein